MSYGHNSGGYGESSGYRSRRRGMSMGGASSGVMMQGGYEGYHGCDESMMVTGGMVSSGGGYSGGMMMGGGYGGGMIMGPGVGVAVQVNVLEPAFFHSTAFFEQRHMHRQMWGAHMARLDDMQYEAWFAWQHEMRFAQYSEMEQRSRLMESLRARDTRLLTRQLEELADRLMRVTSRIGGDEYGRVQEISTSTGTATTTITQQLREQVAAIVERKSSYRREGHNYINVAEMRAGHADDFVRLYADWYGLTGAGAQGAAGDIAPQQPTRGRITELADDYDVQEPGPAIAHGRRHTLPPPERGTGERNHWEGGHARQQGGRGSRSNAIAGMDDDVRGYEFPSDMTTSTTRHLARDRRDELLKGPMGDDDDAWASNYLDTVERESAAHELRCSLRRQHLDRVWGAQRLDNPFAQREDLRSSRHLQYEEPSTSEAPKQREKQRRDKSKVLEAVDNTYRDPASQQMQMYNEHIQAEGSQSKGKRREKSKPERSSQHDDNGNILATTMTTTTTTATTTQYGRGGHERSDRIDDPGQQMMGMHLEAPQEKSSKKRRDKSKRYG